VFPFPRFLVLPCSTSFPSHLSSRMPSVVSLLGDNFGANPFIHKSYVFWVFQCCIQFYGMLQTRVSPWTDKQDDAAIRIICMKKMFMLQIFLRGIASLGLPCYICGDFWGGFTTYFFAALMFLKCCYAFIRFWYDSVRNVITMLQ
jgi:hypothetical protein